jgi:hypothetical protein
MTKRRSLKKCKSERYNKTHCDKKIFVHIPKTGGTSISRAPNVSTLIHSKLKYFKNSDYIFTIIRNPYDRFESAFWHHKTLDDPNHYWGGYSRHSMIREYFTDPNDFIESILNVESDRHKIAVRCLKYVHFIPQFYFLSDKKHKLNKRINKFIIYSKNLSEDVKKYADINIGYLNKTQDHPNVPLNNISKQFINNYYKKDFELLSKFS